MPQSMRARESKMITVSRQKALHATATCGRQRAGLSRLNCADLYTIPEYQGLYVPARGAL